MAARLVQDSQIAHDPDADLQPTGETCGAHGAPGAVQPLRALLNDVVERRLQFGLDGLAAVTELASPPAAHPLASQDPARTFIRSSIGARGSAVHPHRKSASSQARCILTARGAARLVLRP